MLIQFTPMKIIYYILNLLLLFSCTKEDYETIYQYEEGEEYLAASNLSLFPMNRFDRSMGEYDLREIIKFGSGQTLFKTGWVSSPASTTSVDGLGPTFNAKACSNCHFKDGRGNPIASGASNSRGFLIRISETGQDVHGGPIPVPGFGDQLQTNSILNVPEEGKVTVEYEIISEAYNDGTTYTLQKPKYTIVANPLFGTLNGVLTSPRVANQIVGMGLMDATSDEEILSREDINDLDNDGISGKANYVWDIENKKTSLGKFGWKSNLPSLKLQVAAAFHGDMGLTSDLFNEDNCPSPQQDCFEAPNGGNPDQIDGFKYEITNDQLNNVTFYQSNLAVPTRRNYKEQTVLRGKELFTDINCIACHSTNIKTGLYPFNEKLENVTYHPYSDFLLHDMGEALADNRPDFLANGREWRTQPLWGIGLIKTNNNHTFLLHDGRARNIEEAILWHGGEAENSKQNFKRLNKQQRLDLLNFINSL